MNNRFHQIIACVVLSACCFVPPAYAQSNSKGKNSSVVVGILKEVDAAGKEFKVLQAGEQLRVLHADTKSRVYFVGIADMDERRATIGYGVKASCDKAGRIKTISFTPPIPGPKPLGEKRLSMTAAELFKQVDADKDGRVGYGEFGRSVYHSPKHGPDHFRKADRNSDGSLNSDEFRKALEKVSWWTLSRKTPEAWFQETDTDSNQKLSIKEFALICTSGNHIDKIFKRADRDDSGNLSSHETCLLYTSPTPRDS